jgi:chromosome segregation ATPase
MDHLSLSLIDLIILMLGAVCLGITIHFFIVSKRNLRNSTAPDDKQNKIAEQWKARYFNDVESKEKELTILRKKLEESEQNHSIYSIESEELRRENKRLVAELDSLKRSMPVQNAPNFMGQLKLAQESFLEQNERIGQLLEQIEIVKENENKRDEVLIENEELSNQVKELKRLLSEKEKQIGNSSQKQSLASEMSSMLDDAYQDFDDLQEKIRSLESQITTSKINNLDYES